jgi:molecular chaperone DnaK
MEDGLFQVKATGGDTFLGGEDFDQRVIDWLVSEFRRETGIDLGPDPSARMRLKEAAEKAKCELSVVRETEIVLPFISGDAADPAHLKTVLSRQKYESLTEDLLEQTVAPCWRCLDDARLRADQIDTVLLVGGQSRGLAVAEVIRRVFGREPSRAGNPDESVATGAAIQTGITLGDVRDLVLLDVTPHTLGIETRDGTFTPLIERNSTIPTRKARVFTTKADNQTRLEVHVLQGESDMAAYNKSLAKFALNDIRPAAKGVPQIEVSFEIDVNGITSVGALDLATGSRQSLTIHPSSGLSRSEVLSLADEARQREAAERNDATKNDLLRQLGSLITYALHWVQVIDGHISPEDRDVILEALAEAKQARRRDGIEALKASLGRMERAASLIAVAVLGRDRPLEGA